MPTASHSPPTSPADLRRLLDAAPLPKCAGQIDQDASCDTLTTTPTYSGEPQTSLRLGDVVVIGRFKAVITKISSQNGNQYTGEGLAYWPFVGAYLPVAFPAPITVVKDRTDERGGCVVAGEMVSGVQGILEADALARTQTLYDFLNNPSYKTGSPQDIYERFQEQATSIQQRINNGQPVEETDWKEFSSLSKAAQTSLSVWKQDFLASVQPPLTGPMQAILTDFERLEGEVAASQTCIEAILTGTDTPTKGPYRPWYWAECDPFAAPLSLPSNTQALQEQIASLLTAAEWVEAQPSEVSASPQPTPTLRNGLEVDFKGEPVSFASHPNGAELLVFKGQNYAPSYELDQGSGSSYSRFRGFYRLDYLSSPPDSCTPTGWNIRYQGKLVAACKEGYLDPATYEIRYQQRPKFEIEQRPGSWLQSVAQRYKSALPYYESTHAGYRLVAYLTDDQLPQAERKQLVELLNQAAPDQIFLWVDYATGQPTKYEYFYGAQAQKLRSDDSDRFFKRWLEALRPAAPSMTISPLQYLLHGIADLLGQAQVPAKYWDCSRGDYVRLPFVSEGDCPGDCLTPENWAFVAGVWDGVVEEIGGIPTLLDMLMDAQKRRELWRGIQSLQSPQTWSILTENLLQSHDPSKPCLLAHTVAKEIVGVTTLFVGVGFASKADKLTLVAKLSNPISDLGQLVLGMSRFAIKGSRGLYRTAGGFIRLTAQGGSELLDASRQLITALTRTPAVFEGKTLNLLFPAPLVYPVANVLELIKDTGGRVRFVRVRLADETEVLAKVSDDLAEALARLRTKLADAPYNWQQVDIEQFADDFIDNADALAKFESGALDPQAWRLMRDTQSKKVHLPTLTKVTELLRDTDFMAKLQGGEATLADILKNAANPLDAGTASKLVTLTEHLDNLRIVVKNHHDVEGLDKILTDLKISTFEKQDGITHSLNHMKELPAGSVQKVDYVFEPEVVGGLPCTNCRFDVQMVKPTIPPSGWVKYYEYKSYLKAENIDLDQFKNYLATVDKLSELRYIFNAKKLSTEQAKTGMKAFFVKNYDTIWTTGTAKGLFGGLTLKNGLPVNNQTRFKSYLEEIESNNSLFDFVESI